MSELIIKGQNAKNASYDLGIASTKQKDDALMIMAEELIKAKGDIISANKIDLDAAVLKGTSKAMLDRLALTDERIESMAAGLKDVIKLQDPIGEVISMWQRPNGLQIGQKRVPLGVIGIIYEARPNVTCDAAGLCIKTGNAVILRGGSEAINSNKAIVKALTKGIERSGLPKASVQLVEDTSREVATEMMRLNEFIDVLIPRGGAGLIQAVLKNATVPVIETGTGNCHIYVDKDCDFEMAKNIVINAKASRPSVCNAAEKLLINEKIVEDFLPIVVKALRENGVAVKGDEVSQSIINDIEKAAEEDWGKEYLDYIIAVKVVKDVDEAISHINKYGTGHSEAIITESYKNSQKFLQRVDAAAVYVNASTRFTDGSEFGFGAEIGISTQKLHARGPMGLKELTTIKYIIYGNGQIR
ncbi:MULTISPECIES: glutamate-5-semialdehyde dehydrogenase [Clostridium]|jgi:glutamate-5-semialdehyde dehydrogenase (EC 1.2.1.41)|uniref:Gamma-glutamyl phosphate reductase n=2 Tax=Clostridium beijerinckii TaxID=1520 RepID=PROA_CLOB8|nr:MULTISPECIES: glutamate-5-semialdehyde dehydrogenase [Clostridium]A6LPD5.1 RecName: Full=Gamma-glutamyl phosphate reductase; Short=GPR; AltName: Full=Glutamate-5-semialdehyde dehydrogenase; AltName: Full=Glutamyl-gamma-semialdehyde dehydrogenase; Short=GSA dehydrogenase [Clostridium beijerinckii NCIMB 8052]ABR32215.1 gamma-glutamyl phosphate reductase [Clostridium beijerinckii NCIMB 8052]AIU00348.1 gamma-glutamyl phosphate reductase [Clostridium beijerinckii ATCC 35702]MBF7808109.1 glutamate